MFNPWRPADGLMQAMVEGEIKNGVLRMVDLENPRPRSNLGCAVITVNSGRNYEWLDECKQSILSSESTYPIEWICIDNIGRTKTIGEAYNEGIAKSKFPFFLIVDDDDQIHSSTIQILMDKMLQLKKENLKYYRIACHQLLMDDKGGPLALTNMPCQGLFDKEAVLTIGGYPSVSWEAYRSPLGIPADVRMMIKGFQAGLQQAIIPAHLYAYRIHRGQASFPINQEGYEDVFHRAQAGKNFTEEGKLIALDWAVLMDESSNWTKAVDYQEKWDFKSKDFSEETTIGIITHNNEKEIATTLKQLSMYTPKSKLVVIDNGSTDNTRQILKAHGIEAIEQENVGFPKAVNQLMENCTTEYLLLLNPDVFVTPRWLTYLRLTMARHVDANCGIVGCKMITPEGAPWHEGIGFDENGVPINMVNLKWEKSPCEIEVQGITFGLALIRKAVFSKIKCDESFGTGLFEDIDYCIRARKEGYSAWYTPYVTCVHKIHSSWKNATAIDEQYKKNLKLFMEKQGKQMPSSEWLKDKLKD